MDDADKNRLAILQRFASRGLYYESAVRARGWVEDVRVMKAKGWLREVVHTPESGPPAIVIKITDAGQGVAAQWR